MKRLLCLTLWLSGCTHALHISHQADFGPTYAGLAKGRWIEARAEQFVIMGFVTQTDFVNQAFRKLESACPNGRIQGVQTQSYTDHGFFSWTNRIDMQGLCL